MDRNLSREFWSEGFRAVVTPLTVPLISRMALLECQRTRCSGKQRDKLVERLTREHAAKRSCFYVFISDSQKKSHVQMNYKLSYSYDGKNPRRATLPVGNKQKSTAYKVQKKLLRRYLPFGSQSRTRNTLGFIDAKADLVCGPHINFSRAFSFYIQPKKEEEAQASLKWEKPRPRS